MQIIGKYLVLFGLLLLIIGLIIYFFSNNLNWLGKLPGDVRIEKENFRFYFPITTIVLISIILTILVNILRKFL